VNTVTEEVNSLTEDDTLIFWGSASDVGTSNTTTGLRNIFQFIKNSIHTNIIVVSVPHRYELSSSSCVNREVSSFNRKLREILKPFNYVSLIKVECCRGNYTMHGSHLNSSGKLIVSKQIAKCFNTVFQKKDAVPIGLEWKIGSDVGSDMIKPLNTSIIANESVTNRSMNDSRCVILTRRQEHHAG
jgi:hypothetical protein